MARLRFGIIGAGGIAHAHARALRGLPDTAQLVAAADAVPEAAQKFGEEFGITTYGGDGAVEQLLQRNDIDAVSIATPSGLHASLTIAALESGRHVLCEKPLGITLDQVDAMIAAQARSGKALGCVYQQRLHPSALIIKQAITDGRFGRILHANSYLKWHRTQAYYDAGGWRGTWAMDGGGALMNQSIHYIDLLQWLAGPLATLQAYTGTLNHRIETEDAAVAAVRFQSGALGTIEGMTNAIAGTYDRVEIYGTLGAAVIEGGQLVRYYTTAEAIPPTTENPRPSTNLAEAVLSSFAASHPNLRTGHKAVFATFIDAVLDGREVPVTAQEARKAIEIILSIYRAAREGTEVRVEG